MVCDIHHAQPGSIPWVHQLTAHLDAATRLEPQNMKTVLPLQNAALLLEKLCTLLKAQPTVVEVTVPAEATVTVVGDTHGQFHDVCHLIKEAGYPGEKSHFIFNGDFVDRGSWGLETVLLLAAWKIVLPGSVHLLRGNHESSTCTQLYGFKAELAAKYGGRQSLELYRLFKKVFAQLPLAAVVNNATLVVHGGMWRKPGGCRSANGDKPRNKRKRAQPVQDGEEVLPLELGDLEDLRAANKGGLDPSGRGSSVVATDVMWSDPVGEPGLHENIERGVGLVFGKDITQRFLEENGLGLVLRSHEGPDAREDRIDMDPMDVGWTLDHDTPGGKLMTVFSAPDYPQHQLGGARTGNAGAFAVLRGPSWCDPEMRSFSAVLPRPQAPCYYELCIPGSDSEMDLRQGSEGSGATSVAYLSDRELDDDAATSQQDADMAMAPHAESPAALADAEQGAEHGNRREVFDAECGDQRAAQQDSQRDAVQQQEQQQGPGEEAVLKAAEQTGEPPDGAAEHVAVGDQQARRPAAEDETGAECPLSAPLQSNEAAGASLVPRNQAAAAAPSAMLSIAGAVAAACDGTISGSAQAEAGNMAPLLLAHASAAAMAGPGCAGSAVAVDVVASGPPLQTSEEAGGL